MFDDDSLIDPNLTSALQALTLPLIYQTILNDDRCLGLRHHDLACARALGFDAPEPDLGLPDRPCLISPTYPELSSTPSKTLWISQKVPSTRFLHTR